MKLLGNLLIRKIDHSDRVWVQKVLSESWGSCKVVTRGIIHQADKLPGFIGEINGHNVGMLTWNVDENMLEIVTLNVLRQRAGIGRALVHTLFEEAEMLQCTRVWVITTNDNTHALPFYKSLGFAVSAVHKDAITESRKLKPEIPIVGIDGVMITDEIELEKILAN